MLALLRGRGRRGLAAARRPRGEIEQDLGRSTSARPREDPRADARASGRVSRKLGASFRDRRRPRGAPGRECEATLVRCWLGLAEVRLGNLDAARAAAPPCRPHPARCRDTRSRTRAHLVLCRGAPGRRRRGECGGRGSRRGGGRRDRRLGAAGRRGPADAGAGASRRGRPAAAAEQAQVAAGTYAAKGFVAATAAAGALLALTR